MDDITDKAGNSRPLRHLSRFVDAKKLQIEAFGENKMGERAYRRAERIVLAMNLLTNPLSPEEPVRKEVRATCIRLLGQILEARSEMRSVSSQKVQAIKASIRELVSMVRILGISGFVSFQNAEIVIEALDELSTFIDVSEKSLLSDILRLSKNDLSDAPQNQLSIKDIRDNKNLKDTKEASQDVLYKNSRHDSRSNGILEALRSNGTLGVRDIALNFPEYSEKTIQRELALLISQGTVRKIGFKRWSRYAIAEVIEPAPQPVSQVLHIDDMKEGA